MVSLELEAEDGQPLPGAQPGQFVTLRLRADPGSAPVVRSYSLSGAPGGARYRISVKVEPHGAAGRRIRTAVRVGDRLEVGAPRGVFILDDGDRPVVLVSAGVGATPMLAMCTRCDDAASTRDVWWLHGARNRAEHAFADRGAGAPRRSRHGHRRIWYSRPDATDRAGSTTTRWGASPPTRSRHRRAERRRVLLCGPTAVHGRVACRTRALGVAVGHIHTEVFGTQGSLTPGIVTASGAAAAPTRGARGYRATDLVRADGS